MINDPRVNAMAIGAKTPGEYDRINGGDYARRGMEPPPSEEFDAAVSHYKERFAGMLDRTAGGVQDLGRQPDRRSGRRVTIAAVTYDEHPAERLRDLLVGEPRRASTRLRKG